jgi:hypothetical protein
MKNGSIRSSQQHRWKAGFGAMALVAIAMVLHGCASPKTGSQPHASSKRTPNTLASPDLLLAEALRQYVNNRDGAQALAMAQLAVERAPERADALWIYLQICSGSQGCRPEPLEAQLRKLDPTNGIVWLGPLNRAVQQNNQAEADQILEAIGRSQRVELGWNGMVAKIATALAERTRNTAPENKLPLAEGLNEAVGLLSRITLPAFQPLSDSCPARRLGERLAAARCLLVSAILQRGDTYVSESIGLGIAQRLAATDIAGDSAKVDQRIAVSRYQRDSAGEIIAGQVEREKFTSEMLDLMNKLRREQDVFTAVIRWAGRPLAPPLEK